MTSLLPELFESLYKDLNTEQHAAMKKLHSPGNVFITGSAGTGKSHLIKNYLKGTDPQCIPVLASTGAAAVLIGGRTFHSFFSLGIMEGGAEKTIERALKDKRALRRLKKANAIVIDEISMLPGEVLQVAERIASLARNNPDAWGGLKIIAVGDFAQLPPINRFNQKKDWAFSNPVWEKTQFDCIELKELMRVQNDQDSEFTLALHDLRLGKLSDRLRNLLDWRTMLSEDDDVKASILFARKVDVERINNKKLAELSGETVQFETIYRGRDSAIKSLKKSAPIGESLKLKEGAFVMIRQNDPRGAWVNGSLGHILNIKDDALSIKLLSGGIAEINKSNFSQLDAEGNEAANAKNFPITLAWAVTIHKSQGATLDKAVVSLRGLWEPGQAYVAVSRVRSSEDLLISGWDEKSIIADPQVQNFHKSIQERQKECQL